MNKKDLNQTYASDGYTCGPTYDTGPPLPPMIDEMGLPPGGDQDPPEPPKPQGFDPDEPSFIDRQRD